MGENSHLAESSISHAKTYEEMGEFWDTHDTAEYVDLFEEVTVDMRAPRHRRISIEPDMFEALRQEAERRGVSTETLVNLWLMEKLRTGQIEARRGAG